MARKSSVGNDMAGTLRGAQEGFISANYMGHAISSPVSPANGMTFADLSQNDVVKYQISQTLTIEQNRAQRNMQEGSFYNNVGAPMWGSPYGGGQQMPPPSRPQNSLGTSSNTGRAERTDLGSLVIIFGIGSAIALAYSAFMEYWSPSKTEKEIPQHQGDTYSIQNGENEKYEAEYQEVDKVPQPEVTTLAQVPREFLTPQGQNPDEQRFSN